MVPRSTYKTTTHTPVTTGTVYTIYNGGIILQSEQKRANKRAKRRCGQTWTPKIVWNTICSTTNCRPWQPCSNCRQYSALRHSISRTYIPRVHRPRACGHLQTDINSTVQSEYLDVGVGARQSIMFGHPQKCIINLSTPMIAYLISFLERLRRPSRKIEAVHPLHSRQQT